MKHLKILHSFIWREHFASSVKYIAALMPLIIPPANVSLLLDEFLMLQLENNADVIEEESECEDIDEKLL